MSEENDLNLKSDEKGLSNENDGDENQWINELRQALERGCDLGTIRNIGKCRSLTEDLRLNVWKVCHFLNINFNYSLSILDMSWYQ